MHFPTKRQTTAHGSDDNGWAKYWSIEDSVDDFLLWFDMWGVRFGDFKSVGDVISFMKSKGYFEDSLQNYLNDVSLIYQEFAHGDD